MATLDSVEVEGYKSIRSARIELGPINVLIGANGTGKSNLLGLFGMLAALADRRLQLHVSLQGGANALLHFGRKRTASLRIGLRFEGYEYKAVLVATANDTLTFDSELVAKTLAVADGYTATRILGAPEYSHEHLGSKESIFDDPAPGYEDPEGHAALAAMRTWRRFHFHDTGRASPMKQKRNLDDNQVLRSEGDNLAPFLRALHTTSPGAYHRIVTAVRSVAPFFDDFVLEPDAINPSQIQLGWRHASSDEYFSIDALSDGTLRFICLATLLLQPKLPSLIVIDEPELGLHPFAIEQLAALVRAASSKTQILLATQSVTLLDQFQANEVVVTENVKGESSFKRLDEAALAEWKQEYSLGELWLKNVLGGRPR